MLDMDRADLARLSARIAHSDRVTPELIRHVMARIGFRGPWFDASNTPIERLVGAGAWTEVALALVIELPDWTLSRLDNEDGEWCCTLVTGWQLPRWMADSVDGRHAILPLAILSAIVAALEQPGRKPLQARVTPLLIQGNSTPVNCENYA
ncbi:hypothetical protein [Pseudaminobacter soli (ex Li et al. 2025)]|uniref:Uncharacterized protein n=1 Tax=Pseudaminobacter soli (ex Li et al. 2025) TaxID=1295366 RepID=A0A2P7SNV0_9HYPH|nr:hypothetical protein [Mesorhizobium soli]PSJ64169.1 hypothetical protein C7I85_03440 [Mesorhizobium soli]